MRNTTTLLDFVALAHLGLLELLHCGSQLLEISNWAAGPNVHMCGRWLFYLPEVVQRPTHFEVGLNEEYRILRVDSNYTFV